MLLCQATSRRTKLFVIAPLWSLALELAPADPAAMNSSFPASKNLCWKLSQNVSATSHVDVVQVHVTRTPLQLLLFAAPGPEELEHAKHSVGFSAMSNMFLNESTCSQTPTRVSDTIRSSCRAHSTPLLSAKLHRAATSASASPSPLCVPVRPQLDDDVVSTLTLTLRDRE